MAAVRSFFRHQVLIGSPGGEPGRRRRPAAPRAHACRARSRPARQSGSSRRPTGRRRATCATARSSSSSTARDCASARRSASSENGVDLEERLVRSIGKGGKERIVPLGRSAADALRRYLSRGRPFLDKPPPPRALPERQGRPADARRRVPDPAPPGRESGPRADADPSAPAPPLVRNAPARGRRRPTQRPGDARPRRSRHDRALHARHRPQAPRGVLLGPPAREEKAQGFRWRADGKTQERWPSLTRRWQCSSRSRAASAT